MESKREMSRSPVTEIDHVGRVEDPYCELEINS